MLKFFITRRVLTNLMTLFIVVVGGYQFFHVRREAFPEVSFDFVSITTPYPGASPEEVDRLVTQRIEEHLRTVSGLEEVYSTSIENRSVINIKLNEDSSRREADKVIREIEQAVNRVQGLPDEAERSMVQEITSDRPLITLSVAGGESDARRRFADQLADVLEDVPGVSRVDRQGYRKKEIWIEADRQKLTQSVITLDEMARAVQTHNLDVSAGTVEIGTRELWVRAVGSVYTPDDVGALILRGNDARSYLRIRDVARVTERLEEERVMTRANGKPAIHLYVRKLKSGDTITLADAVKKIKTEFEPRVRELNMEMVLSDDISFFIKRRLRVMTTNLTLGGVLILGALFVFLDWRLALVAAAGVPISLATAFLVAVPLGFTINLMTLFAFIVVLGMLTDDAVVVAENIYRHLQMGKKPFDAAIEGAREVALPVLGSVSTTCTAFLPFAMMSGIMGKFLFMFPIIVILSFTASAFEAFCILPSHVVDLVPFGRPVEKGERSRWQTALVGGYRRALGWVLSHRVKFLLILIALFGLTALVARWRLRMVLFPPGLIDQFFIKVDLPEGTGLTETRRVLEQIEARIRTLPPDELDAVISTVGLKGFEETIRMGTHYGQARVFLTPEESRERPTQAIVAELRKKVDDLRSAEKIIFEELHPGPPVGRPVQLRVRGRDLSVIETIAGRVKTALREMPGVVDIEDSREGGKDQIRIVLNDKEAAFAGLDVARVARNIFWAVDGGEASVIRRPEERDEIKIKVRLMPEQRVQPQELLALDVLNDRGRAIRLGSVAQIKKVQGPPFLERFNFRSMVTISADVELDKITSHQANARLQEIFGDISEEFPGYELIFGGEEKETRKSMTSLGRAFVVAVFLDFVILASMFASYVQPFIILLTIPIGLLGVVYALMLHGKPASFMALLGVVALAGVVVNNAIVLIDFINRKRAEGFSPRDAALEAGAVRLRPILASSITTLVALFPTAYGWVGYEPFVAPMALSLGWGLAVATPLTVFLIPAAYVFAEDFKLWLSRFFSPAKKLLARWARRSSSDGS